MHKTLTTHVWRVHTHKKRWVGKHVLCLQGDWTEQITRSCLLLSSDIFSLSLLRLLDGTFQRIVFKFADDICVCPWAESLFFSWCEVYFQGICQKAPGGQSGMRAYTCSTRKTRKKGWFFLKTTRDVFRGAKTPFFRKRGVSNLSRESR